MEDEQTQYGIVKKMPVRDLLRVPHKNGRLVVGYPAFGPDTYSGNLAEMQKKHFHSEEQSGIFFREPTTSESISACAYNFEELAKPEILDTLAWLQLGRIVRTSKGVFVNPPKDSEGNPITNEKILMQLLNGVKETNGIYLAEDNANLRDFGYAPYESFERGIQDCDIFLRSGLARLLEHTEEEVAKNLREISWPKFYFRGFSVRGFNPVNEPVLSVAGLDSPKIIGSDRLNVGGYNLIDDSGRGHAFGVLNSEKS